MHFDSVTVSIPAEITGMFNLILSDNSTLKSTSLGKTSDSAGMVIHRRTSKIL